MMMYNPNNQIKTAQLGQYISSVIEYTRDEAIRRQMITYAHFHPSTGYTQAAYYDTSLSSPIWKILPHPLKSGNFAGYIKDEAETTAQVTGIYTGGTYSTCLFFNSFGEPIVWNNPTDDPTPIPTTNYITITSGDKHIHLKVKQITGEIVSYD